MLPIQEVAANGLDFQILQGSSQFCLSCIGLVPPLAHFIESDS